MAQTAQSGLQALSERSVPGPMKLHMVPALVIWIYRPKLHQQMTEPGERVKIDAKVIPTALKAGEAKGERPVQAINKYSRSRFLMACTAQSTHSSKYFLLSLANARTRKGIEIACVRTDP